MTDKRTPSGQRGFMYSISGKKNGSEKDKPMSSGQYAKVSQGDSSEKHRAFLRDQLHKSGLIKAEKKQ